MVPGVQAGLFINKHALLKPNHSVPFKQRHDDVNPLPQLPGGAGLCHEMDLFWA